MDDGGSNFRKRVVETIYVLAKIQEDEKVKRLKEEVEDLKMKLKVSEAEKDDFLANRDHYKQKYQEAIEEEIFFKFDECWYCGHEFQDERPPRCVNCSIKRSPCNTWCINLLGRKPFQNHPDKPGKIICEECFNNKN